MNGSLDYHSLSVAIAASGVPLPPRMLSAWHPAQEMANHLIARGLLLVSGDYGPDRLYEYGSQLVYSDERLLDQADLPESVPLDLPAVGASGNVLSRAPNAVMLDLLALLQAFAALGGIRLTKAGEPRAADMTKLSKAMKWDKKSILIDGFSYPAPIEGWLRTLLATDLLGSVTCFEC